MGEFSIHIYVHASMDIMRLFLCEDIFLLAHATTDFQFIDPSREYMLEDVMPANRKCSAFALLYGHHSCDTISPI